MHQQERLDELGGDERAEGEQDRPDLQRAFARKNRGTQTGQSDPGANIVPRTMGVEKCGFKEIKLVCLIRVVMPGMGEEESGKQDERGAEPTRDRKNFRKVR